MLRTVSLLFVGAVMFTSCSTNTITGRRQLKLVDESQLQQMAVTEYQSFLSSNKVLGNATSKDADMVNRVGQRVVNAVNAFYKQNNISNELQGYNWEIKLVDSKEVNAWCMPGGKIVVYTGLLPVTQNEAALANVIGHEVSHALFSHSNERMSQGMIAQYGSAAADVLLSTKGSAATRNIFSSAVGIGSQLGISAFSRKHELEADQYGMIWAAMAGYNPEAAIGLWERMGKLSEGNRPPEILSTHPGPEKRIEKLRAFLPTAMKYYQPMNTK